MGSSTSVFVLAPPQTATRISDDSDLKDAGATEGEEKEEEDVFSNDEVAELLTAVSSVCKVDTTSNGDKSDIFDSYKHIFLSNFCGSLEEESRSAASIRRSTILNLSPAIVDFYLRDRLNVLNSHHRGLMCRYITQFSSRERNAKEMADRAAAAASVEGNSDRSPVLINLPTNDATENLQTKRPIAISRRKTQRFITKIDMSEHTITCVRRTVSPSDFAISHRWQARPSDPRWAVTRHIHTESCWEEGAECPCLYIDYDPCAVSGENLYCNYILKEWTVVCACEENMGGRVLSYPDKSYKCSLTLTEVENLSVLLAAKQSLWCDYICINQADPCDKMEQIPLMGNLYFTACTLILGADLASCVPPDDYLFRAWCMQERDHGAIECNWDWDSPDKCDLVSLRQFVCEVLRPVPAFATAAAVGRKNCGVQLDLGRHALHGGNLCAVFEYVRWFNFENEPINEMTQDKISALAEVVKQVFNGHLHVLYPQYKTQLMEVAEELYVSIRNEIYDEDDLHVSRCFLKLREVITCPLEVQPLTCQFRVFDSQALYTEDRLYALWGVPMWMRKQQQLPYPNHAEALRLIYKSYPSAEFAFYRRGPSQSFVSFTYFTHVQDLMLHFLTNGHCVAKEYPCQYHAFDITADSASNNHAHEDVKDSSIRNASSSLSIVVAVDHRCIGVGLKEAHQENDQAAMWVVFSKHVLQLLFDSDVELFSRLCFLYLLYEVGLFNNDNYTERIKLYKFCCRLK